MNIQDLKTERDNKLSELLTKCKVFFAFSTEQFNENKTQLQEGEKYVSMGAGGYLPKGNVDAYINGSKEIRKWFKSETTKNKNIRRENIAHELSNCEAYYTGTIEDALSFLGSGYTAKEVWKVYHEERQFQDI